MIEMDRLLELIDQFAAAEARMKWAPNKKLHLEVAVIKAIQTLSQVTLNEVIENLSALRDGIGPRRRRETRSCKAASFHGNAITRAIQTRRVVDPRKSRSRSKPRKSRKILTINCPIDFEARMARRSRGSARASATYSNVDRIRRKR